MVPGFLYDTYKTYKAGTNKFLTWLVDQAFRSASFAGRPTPETKPKRPGPKGKARRAAKKQLREENRIVAISHILPLAQGLFVNDKVPVQVPDSVIKILQKSIAARNECAVWFEAQAKDESTIERNRNHRYFVSVLVKTLEVLIPHAAPAKTAITGPNNPEKSKSAQSAPTHTNLFANLEIEDLELQDDQNTSDNEANKLAKAAAPALESGKNVYEAEVLDEDLSFAVYCMFKDQDRIHEYIFQLWHGYHNGGISLINASTTSNTAVEIVERMETEFFNSFPTFSSWEEVLKTLNLSCDTPGLNLKIFYSQPYQCLQEWSTQESFPKDGVFDQRVDRSKLSDVEIARRELVLLREVLFEYLPLIYGPLPTEDALTKGLRKLYETRKIHIWVVFALQMFLDINCILGPKVGDGLKELQAAGESIRASLEDYISYSPVLEGIWKDDNLENLQGLSNHIHKYIVNDPILATREELFGKAIFGPGKPFYLLSQHPMLCGLSQFAITLKHQQAGMVKANELGIVLAAAHLYNAAQQDGPMSSSWVAMDKLIALWKPETIYFGLKPQEPDEWFNRYLFVQGTPAKNFARNRRSLNHQTKSKRVPKEPFVYPPLMWTLLERYCKTGPQSSDITTEEVELLLSQRDRDQKHASSHSNRLRKQWDKSHKLSPAQLLDVLRDWIAEEEPKIRFDYFGLYKQCLVLMRSLVNATRGAFESWLNTVTAHPQRFDTYKAAHRLPIFIFGCCASEIALNRSAGNAMLKRVGPAIQVSLQVVKGQESASRVQNRRVMEGGEETPPERSAATLWGILEPNHLTLFGRCVHVGICGWQVGAATVEDLPEQVRNDALGGYLLAVHRRAMGGGWMDSRKLRS